MAVSKGWMFGWGAVMLAAGAAHAVPNSIPVIVNGARLSSDAVMIQNTGRTVLPMRTLFESLGAHVEWDPSERAVYAWREDQVGIRLALGDRSAQTLRMYRDPRPGSWGQVMETHPLDAPATMIGGRIFVPIRFAAESLNGSVRFLSAEPAIYIHTQTVAQGRVGPPLTDDRTGRRWPQDARYRGDSRDRADDRLSDRLPDRLPDRRGPNDDRRSRDPRDADSRDLPPARRDAERRYDDPRDTPSRADDAGGRNARARRTAPDDAAYRRTAPPARDDRDFPAALANDLDVSLRIEQSRVRSGDEVPLAMVVRNTGNRSLTIPFRGEQQFDFQVLDRGRAVWNWSANRSFARRASSLTLNPGEEIQFSTRWNGETDSGDPLPPGRYTVRGILLMPARQPRLISEDTIDLR